jgi:heterotetrameric sarcosine oxidase gamma subunit
LIRRISVSAPEATGGVRVAAIELRSCATDIVEIAPLRGRADEIASLVHARGSMLPPCGHLAATSDRWVLCVRPERWLLLEPRRAPGVSAARWEHDCTGVGTAVDLSSGLTVLDLAGPAAREALARGCRLDLRPGRFPAGRAARTLMAQVPVILAARSSGVLLLTPSTTARHFREWLTATASSFGLVPRSDLATIDPFGQAAGEYSP